jgi:ketosteroid isomerase-like protein
MDEATLQRLVDRLAIQDTMTTYAASIDEGDYATLRTVFADDATAVYDKDSDLLRGADEILAWLKDATADLDWQHHMISVYGVEIDGDEATALIYLLSHQTVVGAPHQTPMMTSKYRNRLRRVGDRWRISDLRLQVGWYEQRDFPQPVTDQASVDPSTTTNEEIPA